MPQMGVVLCVIAVYNSVDSKEPKLLDLLRIASSHSLSEFTHKKKIKELGVESERQGQCGQGLREMKLKIKNSYYERGITNIVRHHDMDYK